MGIGPDLKTLHPQLLLKLLLRILHKRIANDKDQYNFGVRELQLFLLDPRAPNFVVRNSPKNVSLLGSIYVTGNKNIDGWVGGAKPNLIPRNGSLKVTNERGK